jgi:predicted ATPase
MSKLLRVSMRDDREHGDEFPFTVPAIASFESLDLSAAVTFFVGENGSGKSTMLESIAIAAELRSFGAEDAPFDPTLGPQRELARCLRLGWKLKSRQGFFLRAEDMFGWARRNATIKARIRREAGEFAAGTRALSEDQALLEERNWADYIKLYDRQSHGETFIELFKERARGPGVYLIDEPEAALSPSRQLALIGLILDRVKRGGQFVIATHSPIILGTPNARIVSFDDGHISETTYDELEHVSITRAFLADREAVLRKLTE